MYFAVQIRHVELFCRESRVKDEVAQELRASSGITAADNLETDH